ncbi:MAG: PadR family transcriptional regulator [Acidimicrobiia bacterium]
MGLKEGLLCLLAGGDSHGYELKSQLEATTGDTWQINIGQIYTTLQRLERDGMVVHSNSGDGRVVYSLTETGRVAASEWMANPVDLAVAGRDEISLKILMAIRSGIDDPRRVIERQRGSTMALLQDYTALKAVEEGDIGWLLHLDRLIFSAEAELRWLDKVESRLESLPVRRRRAADSRKVEIPEEVSR